MTDRASPHLRVGHAERERAVDTLREAAGVGRLTLDELDDRIERALQARTRADLRLVLADLVPGGELEAAVRPASTPEHAGPGWSWQDPLVLTARWDDVVRAGAWLVPPFLEVHPVASNVRLDFVDARMSADQIDVSLLGGAGDTVLVVPEGWGVDLTHVKRGMGSVRSSVAERPAAAQPLLVVRGATKLGGLKVRHPNRWDTFLRDRRIASGGGVVAKN